MDEVRQMAILSQSPTSILRERTMVVTFPVSHAVTLPLNRVAPLNMFHMFVT
jgi:hypothetical protein